MYKIDINCKECHSLSPLSIYDDCCDGCYERKKYEWQREYQQTHNEAMKKINYEHEKLIKKLEEDFKKRSGWQYCIKSWTIVALIQLPAYFFLYYYFGPVQYLLCILFFIYGLFNSSLYSFLYRLIYE